VDVWRGVGDSDHASIGHYIHYTEEQRTSQSQQLRSTIIITKHRHLERIAKWNHF
jgi:hypothetical protein